VKKYVMLGSDPFELSWILDRFLGAFADSTVGVALEPPRRRPGAAWILRSVWSRIAGRLRSDEVARKRGIATDRIANPNSRAFRDLLSARGAELIVSIFTTRKLGRKLLNHVPGGVLNCHPGLLPRYRGLWTTFWALANGERESGVTIHFMDERIDHGPIVHRKVFPLKPRDSLRRAMRECRRTAAEALIEAVRRVEAGTAELLPNSDEDARTYSRPRREDLARFFARGHRWL
jgi:methionyl-tRNA formyltransferase